MLVWLIIGEVRRKHKKASFKNIQQLVSITEQRKNLASQYCINILVIRLAPIGSREARVYEYSSLKQQ